MIEKIKEYLSKNFYTVFYLFFSFALYLGIKLVCNSASEINNTEVFTCFKFLFFPHKYSEIIRYILASAVIFILFIFYPVYYSKIQNYKCANPYFYILFLSTLNAIISLIKTSNIHKALIIYLVLIVIYAVCFYLSSKIVISFAENKVICKIKKFFSQYILKNYKNMCLIGLFLMFFFQPFPYVFQDLKVINEFSDIPEQTILKSGIVNNEVYEQNVKLKSTYLRLTKKNTEIKEYIKANHMEMHWKILSRFVLYHHSHLLVPTMELELKKDPNQIFAQYGLLNANFLRIALKCTDGINYQNYFKVYYAFYYIYYFTMLYLAYKIFRNKNYIYMLLASIVISINVYNFEYFYLAPGCNPMRHFLDIVVVYLMYKYMNSGKFKYYVTSLFTSLGAILLNWNMGLFLYLSFIPTFWYKNYILCKKDNLKKELWIILGSLIIFPIVYYFSTIGADYTKEYFVKGLLGWTLSSFKQTLLVLYFIVAYGILYKLKQTLANKSLQYISFFSFIYLQGLLLYYIWGSDTKHLMVITPFIAFVVLMFVKLLIDNIIKIPPELKHKIVKVLILSVFVVACLGFKGYVRDYINFNKIFKKHVTYKWNFKNAKFLSTINPKYFEDSIMLLKKYSSNENGVYMISKYDYFIPFLSDKYNSMPYINSEWYVLSKKEIDNVLDRITSEKPKIIYADNNIMYKDTECFSPYNLHFQYLNLECQAHKDRIRNLEYIYKSVIKDYEPIESSYLLTAYRRK